MKFLILVGLIFSFPAFADTGSETERLLDVGLNQSLDSATREGALKSVAYVREEPVSTRVWSKIIKLTRDNNREIRNAASLLKGKFESLYRERRLKQIDLSDESNEDLLLLIKSDNEPTFLRAVAIYKLCERNSDPEFIALIQKFLSNEMKWNFDKVDQEFFYGAVHFAKGRLNI